MDTVHAAADGLDEVVAVGEDHVGRGAAPQQRPDPFDRIEVGCVGGELHNVEPVVLGRVLPSTAAMDVSQTTTTGPPSCR